MIEHSELLKQLSYDPTTGIFTRIKSCPGFKVGKIVGCKRKDGYLVTTFQKKFFYVHRLAWFYVYKEMPSDLIDHINGIRNDNRIENLRVVTHPQNAQNAKHHKDNKSGLKGAYWHKANKNWRSSILVNGKKIDLGSFKSAIDAHQAYVEASKKHQTHGIYKNV